MLLWKASSPTATLYLLGSIHVGDKGLYPLPANVESAFAASKVLVVEVNAKQVDQAKAIELVQKYGMYSGDDGLSKHLSPETADALYAYCAKIGLPKEGMEKLKPWVVAITLVTLAFQRAGEDPSLGVDLHFLNASQPPQRIAELESAEFQISLLASASEQEQQDMLAATLKQVDTTKDFLNKIRDAYTSGDPEAVVKLMREREIGSKTLEKKLIDDRNVTMTASLEEYLRGKEPCFVVVGAAHLVGEKGIVKLLKSKGYTVEQIGAGAP